MTNIDVSKMTEEQFQAAYEKAQSEKKEKGAINTAPISLNKQLDRFTEYSFSEEETQALHMDALSV